MTAIWFARVRSLSGPGSRMTPVSREGWMIVAGFIAAMIVGATLFVLLMVAGAILLAIVIYALIAAVGGGTFIWAAVAHGDNTRTAADYRAMRRQTSGVGAGKGQE